ncbi:hypothetical protein [Allomuricauda sp. NBRC 101325]|uniref:hypothetical protein n=1 Tax=Allomuricauda sp. NBRC 101325 TaxID=1113758 RepID=UPI0025571162|nr:hypothetical protein [Muricauda sp. NBRC 101325]
MKTIISKIFFIICVSVYGQDSDCEKFKTGSFEMYDPQTGINYVTRNDSTQIEYLPKLGVKVSLNVRWIDDCSLELTFKEVLENPKDIPIQEFTLISEIIETQNDYYIMTSKATDMDLTLTRKYTKVE